VITVALSKRETLSIYDALDKHPNNLYKRVWKKENGTIAVFLNERETGPYSRQYVVVTAIIEFDFLIDSYQDETDYLFEDHTDEPAGELRLIAAGGRAWDELKSYSHHRIHEYYFLIDLGVIPRAFEVEIKCLWCKTTIKITSEDIEKDGRVKCKSCGTKIRPFY
jgi:predicted Zn finger-like uncharacterized protein